MKKYLFSYCLILLLCNTFICYGQKLKSDQIPYSYTRQPSNPVKGINSYQANIQPVYEAKNQQALKDYQQQEQTAEDNYRKELNNYDALVKVANDRYDKQMQEYNKKSLGAKIAETTMLNDGKPVKETIAKPYLAYVPKPELLSSYDYKLLGDTYINIEGLQNTPANALKVEVLLYGFDHTQPRNVYEQQDDLSIGGGSTSVHKDTYYHTEFSYRHAMAVKVYDPNGKELLSITPPELNSYKIYKSDVTDKPMVINKEQLVKTVEENVLQDNLRFINNLLNSKYGYSAVKRVATLYYIKNGDAAYTDLTTAFNEASSGLLLLQQDNASAKSKLLDACNLWEAALKESDLGNKKARINKDITTAILFNLLEIDFSLGDAIKGESALTQLNTMSLSNSDRKTKLDYDVLFAELKSRQQQN